MRSWRCDLLWPLKGGMACKLSEEARREGAGLGGEAARWCCGLGFRKAMSAAMDCWMKSSKSRERDLLVWGTGSGFCGVCGGSRTGDCCEGLWGFTGDGGSGTFSATDGDEGAAGCLFGRFVGDGGS